MISLALLPIAACIPSLLPPQEVALADRLRRLEERLEEQRVELHIPGLAVAVVKDDAVIWAEGFGLADVEKERAVTPETIFAVGSTTKAFTATLAGMLVDEGKLAWDAPITEYLPDFELPIRTDDEDAYVCLRDLLAHRTGFARCDLLWASGKASAEEILATIMKAEPWRGFREEFHYNNIMFLAAGEAEARAAGKPWSELVATRILAPLSMRDTTLSVAEAQKDARLALGYRWDEEEGRFVHVPMRPIVGVAPAGAINSNVLDMAKWVRFQLGRGEIDGERLISEESHRETWTKQIDVAGPVGYGLGWMLQSWKNQPVVEHGGNIDGFAAQVALLPESNLGYVLLANVGATPLQAASMEMVWEALLGAVAEETVAAGDRSPYLGVYLANFGVLKNAKLTVLEKDGKLAIDVPGQMVYTLKEPDAEGKWTFELTNQIAVSFDRDADSRVTGLKMYQSGAVFEAPREGVEIPAEIDLDDARRFLGKYADPALKTDLTVVLQNNRLAIDVPKQMVFELHKPDAEGKRVFRFDPALAVRFDEDSEGAITSMTFFERGTVRSCPRVAEVDPASPAPITPAALHELRGADAREAALSDWSTYRMTGKAKMVHVGIEGTLTMHGNGLDRFHTNFDLEPFATIQTCYDRGFAAIGTSLAPDQELSGKDAEAVRVDHSLRSFLDWRAFFTKVVPLRADELDGRQVWVVKLVAGEGIEVTAWVDAETGDTLREDGSLVLPGGLGELSRTLTFSDFRDVHGMRLPHHMESEDPVNGKTVFELGSLQTGLETSDEMFRLAAQVKDR